MVTNMLMLPICKIPDLIEKEYDGRFLMETIISPHMVGINVVQFLPL